MSIPENTAVVQSAYEYFKTGRIDDLVGLLSDKVEWKVQNMETVPFSGEHHGPQQVAGFFATLANSQDALIFDPQEYIAQGDKVVALGHYKWRIKETGRLFESDFGHVFTIQDGKVTKFQEYTDTAAEIAAYVAA